MSKIVWDASGERLYETGVRNGVLYPQVGGKYPAGYAWNGLTSVAESPEGAEATPIYADDIKYLNLYSAEEFGATVEAYMYPDAFGACNGSDNIAEGVSIGQQARQAFGMCYRTVLGNDEDGEAYGYKLHIIYGAKAAPSEQTYETINDSPDAITFSWELSTTPVNVAGKKPTATLVIDSTKADPVNLATLEAVLYGCDEFSETKDYAIGDVVSYGSGTAAKTYKFTTVHEAGAWDASDVEAISDVVGPQLLLPDEIAAIFAA